MTTPTDLVSTVRASWTGFLDLFEPLRPELYRYARYLTRSPWDAEDLTQDTLARAFVTLGKSAEPPPNPRAWLFRVASNLWIDQQRRVRPTLEADIAPVVEHRVVREAAGTLIAALSPQERAAVVLKDVFDLSLDDIADVLGTTANAIKAALHRGRDKLDEPAAETRVPTPAALDAFCAAFNAHDIDRVAALLLDTATVEVVGATTVFGREPARRMVLWGMMFGAERIAHAHPECGIEPRFAQGAVGTPTRIEARVHRGEHVLLSWYAHADGEAVRAVNRVELAGDQVARVRNFFYSPELIAELCTELGVAFRVNGHKWWVR